jgi:hypothetical protein
MRENKPEKRGGQRDERERRREWTVKEGDGELGRAPSRRS